MKHIICIIVLFLLIEITYSQQVDYPKNDFISPTGEKMLISGTFAELRPNHFHSGIDIRTNSKIGENIYSIADGYVSRINVSPWGFGNAVYINHPNGYKSVYAHLNEFNDEIAKYLEEKQYELEEFSVNLYPLPDELPVKQGDIIGYSGNSGRSYGPHLHFEIRETDTDEPVNPFHFYPDIVDNLKPEIRTLAIYPFDDTSFVAGKNSKKILTVYGKNGSYYVSDIVKVSGNIIFGVEVYDYLNFVGSRNAVYSIDLYIDDSLIYCHQFDKFAFSESRYVNTLVDYEERISSSAKRIQRTYIADNNKLRIYNFTKNKGIYNFCDDDKHSIKYEIKDIHGNTAYLNFQVQSVSEIDSSLKYSNIKKDYTMLMPYNYENYYISRDIRITVSKNCLYENLFFNYNKYSSEKTSKYSDIHKVHDENTPLHTPIVISINAEKIDSSLIDKALIIRENDDNDQTSCGGKYINGFITAKSKKFGKFYILVDTIEPSIYPINIYEGKNMKNESKISFKVTDNLSGVETYNGYIDNQWVLFKYDGKNNLFYYEFDKKVDSGELFLNFIVKDERCNEKTFSAKFYR